jgi:MFS family permease
MGTILLLVQALMGITLALLPLGTSTVFAAVMMLLAGVINGYVNIQFFTWLQKRVPEHLMGRVMSLIMFASVGLTPISTAVAGALLNLDLTALFVGAGVLMALVTVYSLTSKAMREMGIEPGNSQTEPIRAAIRETSELPLLRISTDEYPSVGD